jgi:hypothetical protein
MNKPISGTLVVLFIMGFALVPVVHSAAADSQLHPMCWAGYCPDMRHAPGTMPVDPAADPPGQPTVPSPMGNVGY